MTLGEGERFSEAGVVVGDGALSNRDAVGARYLQRVGVGVSVDADDGVGDVCEHGHAAWISSTEPGRDGTGLGGSPNDITVTGHAQPRGQASDQVNWWTR